MEDAGHLHPNLHRFSVIDGVKMPRRTFFSFHYEPDVWRAWNVRNSWVVKESDEESRGFFDSSVFEASKKRVTMH